MIAKNKETHFYIGKTKRTGVRRRTERKKLLSTYIISPFFFSPFYSVILRGREKEKKHIVCDGKAREKGKTTL